MNVSTNELLSRLRDAQDDRPMDDLWQLLRAAEIEIEHWREAYEYEKYRH